MAETDYFVEYAKSGRSKCAAGKACSAMIEKGELRIGVHFTTSTPMTKYRHWRCVTSKMIENIGDPDDNLGGLESLTPEDQELVRKAFADGFVAGGTEEEKEGAKAAAKLAADAERMRAKAAKDAEKEAAKAAKAEERAQAKAAKEAEKAQAKAEKAAKAAERKAARDAAAASKPPPATKRTRKQSAEQQGESAATGEREVDSAGRTRAAAAKRRRVGDADE
ncbi:hypothetical protein AMAG_05565 [Allomyces macrogynus ATCC 38327]|uniref:PARP-type domain-containing protein n=1 Tax=Allomyces macrogynus (strain ATCC 38327) TaxID=578462 RepID=A0A0L0SC58_ALLM3|nr:hypothetical protein AMAG_05565 [Allomyces macrogynus ATCC 38327]|eukprot:KNE60143.1 hypothetical protein AMAG_05565 [Allomyces macrogynus ATCC 38327]